MEERRFDDLTKTLARGSSRRTLLKGIGGTLLAGIAGVLHGGSGVEAAASHLCCTYQCGQTLTTQCSRQGSCPPPPVGCSTVDGGYFVKRCSDCAPQIPITTTPAPTTTTTTTPVPTTTTTTTTPAPACPAGTCLPGANFCPTGTTFLCSATNLACTCFQSVAGDTVCADRTNVPVNCGVSACSSDDDCGTGHVCIDMTGCCSGQTTSICAACCTG